MEWSKRLTLRNGEFLLEDDSYRFYVTYLEGPALNVPKNERLFLMEYKQFDYPGIASDVVQLIREALDAKDLR